MARPEPLPKWGAKKRTARLTGMGLPAWLPRIIKGSIDVAQRILTDNAESFPAVVTPIITQRKKGRQQTDGHGTASAFEMKI